MKFVGSFSLHSVVSVMLQMVLFVVSQWSILWSTKTAIGHHKVFAR